MVNCHRPLNQQTRRQESSEKTHKRMCSDETAPGVNGPAAGNGGARRGRAAVKCKACTKRRKKKVKDWNDGYGHGCVMCIA